MFQSKNCGHGFDLYVKCQVLTRSAFSPLTPEGELRDRLEDMTGETYVNFIPMYCPICGKKVEEVTNMTYSKKGYGENNHKQGTALESYLKEQLKDPEFARAYKEAKKEIEKELKETDVC